MITTDRTKGIRKYGALLVLVMFLFFAGSTYAQGFGDIGFDDNVDDETRQGPISGLVGVTLLAGAFFGGKKIYDANKNSKDNT